MSYATIADMNGGLDTQMCLSYFNRRELSSSNIDPRIWGPCFWQYYHTMSLTYPLYPTQREQQKMKTYILSIPETLPCKICQEHARNYIHSRRCELPVIVSSGPNLFAFFVEMHNYVNQRKNKPEMTTSEALKYWTSRVAI